MARSAEEAAQEYRQALQDLKDNNKMQINLMTILADDYNSYSSDIIKVIAQQIEVVPPTQKLAVMYVMDSILKNITQAGNYKDHIEKFIHRLFIHVFETGDEKTRLSLHKLRQTWVGIFQRSTLYKIDLAVHGIDPAWPIITPQPSSQSVSGRPITVQPRTANVHVNPHFLQMTASSDDSEKSQLLLIGEKRVGSDPRLTRVSPENGQITVKKEAGYMDSANEESTKRIKTEPMITIIKQEPKSDIVDVDERLCLRSSGETTAGKSPDSRKDLRDAEIENISQSDAYSKKRSEKQAGIQVECKKPRVRSPPNGKRGLVPAPTIVKPTNDLGSHAFITTNIRPQIAVMAPAINGPSTSTFIGSPLTSSVAGPSDKFSTINATSGISSSCVPGLVPIPASSIPPIMPPHLMPSVPIACGTLIGPAIVPLTTPTVAALSATVSLSAPPIVALSTPPVISTETPKLEGIPANNRIFVDGRAYEVSYIDDIPVIERNSLPHRIYFTGAPRNVIIDGVAHLLSFGEEKRVLIDGEEHVLRFGAPSRELYMGNYPFKGAFGGPPIFATINGVRHEIRLSGPPPEVKIEPDPCYELLRHMPRAGINTSSVNTRTTESKSAAHQTSTEQNSIAVDVKGLLAKLQKSGILPATGFNHKKKDQNVGATGNDSPTRSPTPPIPSEHRGEVTERLPKPPTDLMKFSMRALKIRYDSVVESLHQTRHVCPSCGLRFVELKGEKYQHHLDWHFRENLKSKGSARYRSWYLPLEDWLEFSEQEQLVSSTSSHPIDNSDVDDPTKESQPSSSNIPSEAAASKECSVCKEKFEEYWDEDDDIWKLKECVLGSDNRAFHPGCILDASILNRSQSEDSRSEDENCDKNLSFHAIDSLKRKLSPQL